MSSLQLEPLQTKRVNAVKGLSNSLGFYINRLQNSSSSHVSTLNLTSTNNEVQSDKASINPSAASLIAEQKSRGIFGSSSHSHVLAPSTQFIASSMDRYFHRDDMDTVILYLPALDLHAPVSTNDNVETSSLLSSVGESSSVDQGTDTKHIPAMVASVLGQGDTSNNSQLPFSITQDVDTSSKHSQSSTDSQDKLLQEATSTATNVEYAAAKNLRRSISYTRSSAPHAPSAMTHALLVSFSSLVESRMKSWTLLMLRHSLSSGDASSRARLMSLLATNKIETSAMVTKFNITDKEEGTEEATNDNNNVQNQTRKPCHLSLPLSVKIDIDLKLNDLTIHSRIQSIGTVSASFHEDTSFINYYECQLDTDSLVSEMITQARLVVLQAVAKATSSNMQILNSIPRPETTLSQFGASLNLSTEKVTESILHNQSNETNNSNNNNSESTNGVPTRKRSIKWDESVNDLRSVFKKPKRMNSLKRSIKSFGKPNSKCFESAKNATFAEFGNLTQNPYVPKIGRDGRLESTKVHHLSTMNLSARHTLSRNYGGFGGKNVNASFDVTPTNVNNKTASLSALMTSSSQASSMKKTQFTELSRNAKYSHNPPQAMSGLLSIQSLLPLSSSSKETERNLQRTPTQLENILLKQTQNKKTGNAEWD